LGVILPPGVFAGVGGVGNLKSPESCESSKVVNFSRKVVKPIDKISQKLYNKVVMKVVRRTPWKQNAVTDANKKNRYPSLVEIVAVEMVSTVVVRLAKSCTTQNKKSTSKNTLKPIARPTRETTNTPANIVHGIAKNTPKRAKNPTPNGEQSKNKITGNSPNRTFVLVLISSTMSVPIRVFLSLLGITSTTLSLCPNRVKTVSITLSPVWALSIN
jgi:hypothetical protein